MIITSSAIYGVDVNIRYEMICKQIVNLYYEMAFHLATCVPYVVC